MVKFKFVEDEEEEKKSSESKIPKITRILNDHIFSEKNVLKFFFMKKNYMAKKYELYWFFYNPKDLELNNKIDNLIERWHKIEKILLKNSQQWYHPNLAEKQEEIKKILEGSD